MKLSQKMGTFSIFKQAPVLELNWIVSESAPNLQESTANSQNILKNS